MLTSILPLTLRAQGLSSHIIIEGGRAKPQLQSLGRDTGEEQHARDCHWQGISALLSKLQSKPEISM